jgi:hypothetical protein
MKVTKKGVSTVCAPKTYALVPFLFAFLTLPLCANATTIDFYTDGTIQSGDNYDQVNIWDTAMVNMTGGDVTRWISVFDASTLLLSGGSIQDLQLSYSGIAVLTGGNITGTLSTAGTSVVHIYGKNFNFTPNYSNGPGWITGDWADGSSFSIYYRNYEPFPGTHLFLHEIPEPCTLGLVSLGVFILRRNIKIFRK